MHTEPLAGFNFSTLLSILRNLLAWVPLSAEVVCLVHRAFGFSAAESFAACAEFCRFKP